MYPLVKDFVEQAPNRIGLADEVPFGARTHPRHELSECVRHDATVYESEPRLASIEATGTENSGTTCLVPPVLPQAASRYSFEHTSVTPREEAGRRPDSAPKSC